MREIAVFGGSFNPPGLHHLAIVKKLQSLFDQVIVVPCGPRPDKQTTNDILPLHRAAMIDMTFRGLDVEVDLSDLENSVFTRTVDLKERYSERGEVCLVIGSDLVKNGADGQSEIQKSWKCGPVVWENFQFAVVNADPGFSEDDLPPQGRLINMFELNGRSTEIRRAVFERNPSFRNMVTPEVANYVERYDLYRGLPARHSTQMIFQPSAGFLVLHDRHNQWAEKIFFALGLKQEIANPQAIIVIGGDGFMLGAIKKYWHRRLPFIGLNAGHRGFLLNDLTSNYQQKFKSGSEIAFNLFQMSMLHVSFETASGQLGDALCFNDAWLERSTAQATWLKVTVDGQDRIPKMAADGILVATAAGSTAYARAMGAQPIPADSRRMVLVGNNVFEPTWKYALLPISSLVEVSVFDVDKRPVKGFVDGQVLADGESLKWLRVRQSNIAASELGFFPEHDLAEKISRLQFP